MNEKPFYTLDDLALMLGIQRKHAWRAVHVYRIPHKKLGKRIIIPRKDFEEFLEKIPTQGGLRKK